MSIFYLVKSQSKMSQEVLVSELELVHVTGDHKC